jgi:hypothetical protein
MMTRCGLLIMMAAMLIGQSLRAQITMDGMGKAMDNKRAGVTILYMVGEVEVFKATTGQWIKAELEMKLEKGDKVRTQADSRVEINLNDADLLKIGAASEVELMALVIEDPKKEPVHIHQTAGKVLFKIKKLIGRPEVMFTSPTAVAAIRGTVVGQELQDDGSAKFVVLEGQVLVENNQFKGRGQELRAGQWTQVGANQVPLVPKAMNTDDQQQWQQWNDERHGAADQPNDTPTGQAGAGEPPVAKPAAVAVADNPPAAPAAPMASAAPAAPDKKADEPKTEEPPKETPPPVPADAKGDKFSMGGAVGTYTDADGNQITYISLRPDIPLWKFGICLDVQLGFRQEQNGAMVFDKKGWDEPGDLLEKIYYVRYGKEGDPVFIKAGVLPEVSLGYGLIVDGYSNAIQYPDIKRIGVQASIRKGKVGFEGLVNSVREFGNKNGGGVIGTRLSYRPIRIFEIGATGVVDLNQYANLGDRDGDGRPDFCDKFPTNKNEWLDTDDDGLPDGSDQDRDNNNQIEISGAVSPADSAILAHLRIGWEPESTAVRDPEPFNLDNLSTSEKMALVYGVDVGFPLIESKLLKLLVYAQVAKIDKAGWGFAAPGVKFAIWRLKAMAEYRYFNKQFQSSYFNELYELERAQIVGDTAFAKRSTMETIGILQGYYAQLGLDLKFVKLAGSYEDMRGENTNSDKTLYAQVGLAPNLIPKLSEASAYYKKTHVTDFKTWKQEGAIMGSRVGYELSPGTSIILKYQETYLDKNGDGKLETERMSGIETAFSIK